jgi:hypothetical protein
MHNGVPVSLKRLRGSDQSFINGILDARKDLNEGPTRVGRGGSEAWIEAPGRSMEDVVALSAMTSRYRRGQTIVSTLDAGGFSAIYVKASDGIVVITR